MRELIATYFEKLYSFAPRHSLIDADVVFAPLQTLVAALGITLTAVSRDLLDDAHFHFSFPVK